MAAERYQSALVTADDADPDPLAFALSLDSLRAGFGLGASGLRMRRQIELALMFMLCDGSSPLIGVGIGPALASRLGAWATT